MTVQELDYRWKPLERAQDRASAAAQKKLVPAKTITYDKGGDEYTVEYEYEHPDRDGRTTITRITMHHHKEII